MLIRLKILLKAISINSNLIVKQIWMLLVKSYSYLYSIWYKYASSLKNPSKFRNNKSSSFQKVYLHTLQTPFTSCIVVQNDNKLLKLSLSLDFKHSNSVLSLMNYVSDFGMAPKCMLLLIFVILLLKITRFEGKSPTKAHIQLYSYLHKYTHSHTQYAWQISVLYLPAQDMQIRGCVGGIWG